MQDVDSMHSYINTLFVATSLIMVICGYVQGKEFSSMYVVTKFIFLCTFISSAMVCCILLYILGAGLYNKTLLFSIPFVLFTNMLLTLIWYIDFMLVYQPPQGGASFVREQW